MSRERYDKIEEMVERWIENEASVAERVEEILSLLSGVCSRSAAIAERVCREYASPKAGYEAATAIRREALK